MGVTGVSGSDRSAESQSRAAEAAEREARARADAAAAAAAAHGVTAPSSPSLDAIRGASTFEPSRVTQTQSTQSVADLQAAHTIMATSNAVTAGTERLTAANAEVAKIEQTLATELTQLSPSLTPQQLGEYAAAYRAEPANKDAYAEATEAATALATALRDRVPGAVAAGVGGGFETQSASSWLDNSVSYATQALDTYASQSPTASTAVAQTMEQARSRLADQVPLAVTAAPEVLERYAHTGARFAEVAEKAGHAFGLASAALDIRENVGRIAEGDARAEHYVGAGAGIAELGIGVLEGAGVAVSAPVSATVGALALGATAISGVRDFQEQREALQTRLEGLGYDASTAAGLSQAVPSTVQTLRDQGYSAEQVQQLAAAAPGMLNSPSSVATSMVAATRTLGLGPEGSVALLGAMGADGDDVAGQLATLQARLSPSSRDEFLDAMRPVNPAFGDDALRRAADWVQTK